MPILTADIGRQLTRESSTDANPRGGRIAREDLVELASGLPIWIAVDCPTSMTDKFRSSHTPC